MVMYLRIVVMLCVVLREKGLKASETERRLVRYLFDPSRYDVTVRPVTYDDQSVNVTFNLALFQLIEINEKEQVIQVAAWLRQKWMDSKLSWNSSEYSGIKEFNVPPHKLWLPDIVLYNNVNEDNAEYGGNMDTLRTRVIVYDTGLIYWMAPIIIRASCKIRVRDFPFDTQHCMLKFGSWTYDMARLNVITEGIDIDKYLTNLEWKLAEAKAVRTETVYNCCPGVFPDVSFHLEFQRRSLFYVLNLIFPIAVITLLTILAFVLPAESGERVSLAVTLMLAVTVFMLLVAETTPASSESIPLVAVYFIICMIIMFVIIVLLCYISRMYNRGRTDRPMGQWMRRYIFDKLSYIVGIRMRQSYHYGNNASIKGETNNGFKPGVVENSQGNGILMKNNLAFADNQDNGDNKYTNASSGLSVIKRLSRSSNTTSEDVKHASPEEKTTNQRTYNEDNDIDEEYSFQEEWRVVAMTIDRVLFFTFIIIFVIATIACFAHTSFVT